MIAAFGLAAATDVPRSIWGANNPGKGGEHAAMPEAGALHNHAGANHDDENETGDHGEDNDTEHGHGHNETGDHDDQNETDDDDQNETGHHHDENETADNDTDSDNATEEEGTPESLGGGSDASHASAEVMYQPVESTSSA